MSLPVSYNNNTYGAADPWVYYVRNCTSYVAWKIAQMFNGTSISGWGDAYQWSSKAPSNEVHSASSYTPVPGDIAQWISHDHVAYVDHVVNGVAYFDEYNSGYPETNTNPPQPQWGLFYNGLTSANYPVGSPDNYIHVGTLPGSSVAVPVGIDFSGTPNVFTIGGDNNVYQDYWNGSTWVGMASIGTGMSGSPATIVNGSAVNLFTIGTNGTVYTEYSTGGPWSGWTSMNNTQAMKGSPFILKYSTELDLYALGTNGTPYKDTWQPGSGWGGFTSMTGTLASNLSAIQYGSEMDVFGINSSGTPYKDTWNGSGWGGWTPLTGTLAGNITAVPYSTFGEYDLYANNATGHIFRDTWSGSAWSGWQDYGGTFAGSPYTMQFGNDMWVFGRASGDGTMWYDRYHYGVGWTGWTSTDTSTALAGDPSAYPSSTQINMFATDKNGKAAKNTWNGSGWGGFSPLL